MEEAGKFDFSDLIKSKEFEEFYANLWRLISGPLALTDPDFKHVKYFGPENVWNPVCNVIRKSAKGYDACIRCDHRQCKKAVSEKHGIRYYCHAGLVDFAVPIYVEGKHIATISCGQILMSPPTEKGFKKLWNKVKNLDVEEKELKKAYFNSPYMDEDKAEAVLKVLSLSANYFCELGRRLKLDKENLKSLEIQKSLEFIHDHFREPLNIEEVAYYAGFSESHFSRAFHKFTGVTYTDYLQKIRLGEAKKMLEKTDWLITKIAFEVGFGSLSNFNQVFHKYENCTPSKFRKNHKA